MLEPIIWLKTMPARNFCDKEGNGFTWSSASDSFSVTCTAIPVSKQDGTISPFSPAAKTVFIVGMPIFMPAGCTRIQPASFNAWATITENLLDSSSMNALMVKSVPLNGLSPVTNSSLRTRERGVLIALNLASAVASRCVESAKRCSASASRDTASAACFLADTISDSKESASFLAPAAKIVATAEDLTASPDLVDASLAEVSAAPAEALAWNADVPASRNKSMFMDWIFSSSLFTSLSIQNSPATPTETMIQPISPINVIQYGPCSATGFFSNA